jgi:hypothetical protein
MLHYAVPEEVAEAIEEAGGLATMLDNTARLIHGICGMAFVAGPAIRLCR